MKEQLNIQPLENQRTYHGEVVTNSDSDEEDGSSDDEEYQDMSSVISTYPESSAGKATGNLVGAFDELSVNGTVSVNDMGSTTTGGFWRPLRDRSAAGGSAANMAPAGSTGCSASYAASAYSAQSTGKSGTTTGGFDPMKYGHPRVASVADSMETNCPASSSGGKWAKVRAYQPDPDPEPEPEENVWGEGEDEYESSSEDESEDEYPIMSSRR
ncbi:hypothetical protein MPH_00934 [Macrophomina phaseolina MS6]|uniref:Uncharacterized protein n=2 Tax=Macrophomina phaseolina TaxID=35725 RepID=K2SGX1_MACPH|nr:hypothetical protein MPH_00934 [Macrophomina phaseolina MS6]